MKKVITILAVLALIVGAVFAESNDKLNITAEVKGVAPTFSIYGGKAADKVNTLGTQDGAPVALDTDPSEANAVVYIKVTQPTKSKTKTNAVIIITPTVLECTTDSSAKTALPTASTVTAASTNLDTNNYSVASETAAATGIVKLTVSYNGKPVAANAAVDIASFSYTWTKVDTLPVGNYSATITMTYTAS